MKTMTLVDGLNASVPLTAFASPEVVVVTWNGELVGTMGQLGGSSLRAEMRQVGAMAVKVKVPELQYAELPQMAKTKWSPAKQPSASEGERSTLFLHSVEPTTTFASTTPPSPRRPHLRLDDPTFASTTPPSHHTLAPRRTTPPLLDTITLALDHHHVPARHRPANMRSTVFTGMLNVEPYHFEVTFYKPYEEVKASDVLDAAKEFMVQYVHRRCKIKWVLSEVKDLFLLRFLKQEDAFVVGSEPPGDPLSDRYPSNYSRSAADWYWGTGYHMSSEAVHTDSLLSHWLESQDATKVRWYVLLKVPLEPTSQFAPSGFEDASGLAQHRIAYMNAVEMDVENRLETGVASPAKVSADVSKFLSEQKTRTPISNGLLTHSDYGVNPIVLIPIFAEIHNMLAHPDLVTLELSQEVSSFNAKRTTSHFISAVHAKVKDEKEFNAGIFVVLKELLGDIVELHLHKVFNDKAGRTTEIDWVAFCRTAHGWMCVPFSGEGKMRRGVGGDSILQNFCALQRLLATQPDLRHFMQLTACPILMLAVEGTDMRVWGMYFGARIYGSRLFDVSLRKDLTSQERLKIAIKLQLVRNAVRKLCDFYGRLHAATRPPTIPFLFPQPLALLQCLVPPPPPEVVEHLAFLDLYIVDNVDTAKDPARSLYKGVIFAGNADAVSVYVKIVPSKYGAAAHQLLAEHDPPYAPKLYWCHEIIVGYTMVVMAELHKSPGSQSIHPRRRNQRDIDLVKRDIGRALRILHAADYVHGDVRQPNIVITNRRAHLIDFDSADLDGVAEYPASLNPKVKWPGPASALVSMPIVKEHDLQRFQWTIEELQGTEPKPKPSAKPSAEVQEQIPYEEGLEMDLQRGRIAI
ncbi:hypothetical protein GSI_07523 [Ganoderma sinense ZZ0214-1]|uniref:Protein kinase domain-containing protein n=1 Tax=Ganoderma sinense ZZ0214-1 TaxID=1077348 RepID=A0A2G8S9S5_9APHY|nr:hypothetical protein GSI_07523 [Ganoderma sinense ZZ0214-1]